MGKGSKPRNNHSTQFRDNYDDISWNSEHKIDKEVEDMFYADDIDDSAPSSSSEQSEILMGCVRQSLETPINKDTQ